MGCTDPLRSVLSESVASYLCYVMLTCTHADDSTHSSRYLYASNRGHNSVVKLALTPAGDSFVGEATLAAKVTWVRGMNISPDGDYLVVASDSNNDVDLGAGDTAGNIIVYGINHADGSLSPALASSPVATGCDVTFIPK